jgi:hypothetical protein
MGKLLKVKTLIKKSGSKFIITHINEKYYRAEQYIDDKLQAYEVGRLRKNNDMIFGKKTEYKYIIPSANQFGTNTSDKSFGKNKEVESIEYFNSLT